ncbi:teichuronic acid biosynthesis protein TuaB [Peribacillus kribbensis]|uniref:teichuronic acid biosynthesis protein TuaB n=1 Tax=Peribacillus kribbensis TaxID=356658 RepID=UPI0004181609|nr:MOP flippase family protein [Peribacillus kribbensis]
MTTIKGQLVKGARWTGISTMAITVIQILQFVYLGNRMSVAEFGLVGMLTTIMMFAQILLESGLGSAVIQKEKVTEDMLSTLFWLNVAVGILISLVLFGAGGLIAGFFHRTELGPLIRLLSLLFLTAGIGQQSQYLLQKDLRFQTLGKIEAGAAVFSFLLLLMLSLLISTIYAFVFSQIALYSLRSVLYFAAYGKWKPRLIFRLRECREVLSFGAFQLASRIVNRLGSNMDMILIGRFMGAEALGIYNLVYQIVTIPVLRINPIMTRVAFPVFSKNQNSHTDLNDGFLYMTKLLGLAAFPMLMGLTAVADVFVPAFFGEKWSAAIPILQIMAIVGMLRVLMNPNGSIILAKGRANIAFYWDSGMLLLYGAALYAAVLTGSLEWVAWSYVAVSVINFILGRWLLAALISLRWASYLQSLALPFVLSLIMSCIAFMMNKYSSIYFHGSVIPLAISAGTGVALYAALLYKMYPQYVLGLIKKRAGGKSI